MIIFGKKDSIIAALRHYDTFLSRKGFDSSIKDSDCAYFSIGMFNFSAIELRCHLLYFVSVFQLGLPPIFFIMALSYDCPLLLCDKYITTSFPSSNIIEHMAYNVRNVPVGLFMHRIEAHLR